MILEKREGGRAHSYCIDVGTFAGVEAAGRNLAQHFSRAGSV